MIEASLSLQQLQRHSDEVDQQKREIDALRAAFDQHTKDTDRARIEMEYQHKLDLNHLRRELEEVRSDGISETQIQREQADKYRKSLERENVKFHKKFGISLEDWKGDDETIMTIVTKNIDLNDMPDMFDDSVLNSPEPKIETGDPDSL